MNTLFGNWGNPMPLLHLKVLFVHVIRIQRLLQERGKFEGDVITGLVNNGENFTVSGKNTAPDQTLKLET